MKVTVENKDKTSLKFDQGNIVIGKLGTIVLIDKSCSLSQFSGTVISNNDTKSNYKIGHYSKTWAKESFMKFEGRVIFNTDDD